MWGVAIIFSLVFLRLSQLPRRLRSASCQRDPLKPKSDYIHPVLRTLQRFLISFREKVKFFQQPTRPSMSWFLITSLTSPLDPSFLASMHLVCSYPRAFALAMAYAYCACLPGMHKAHSLITFKSCPDVTFSMRPSLITHLKLQPPPSSMPRLPSPAPFLSSIATHRLPTISTLAT